MAAKKKSTKKIESGTLTLANVKSLGRAIIDVADRYPTRFRTEIDFYPIVVAFLSWKLPGLKTEFPVGSKKAIDFKVTGTTNPAYLELALAPRVLGDLEDPPDAPHPKKTQLYASQNLSELRKLAKLGGATKGRFLLLVDLRKTAHGDGVLKKKYDAAAKKLSGTQIVNVVYIHRKLEQPEVIKVQTGSKQGKAGKKKGAKKGKKK